MSDFGTCVDCGESNNDTFPDTVRCEFCQDGRVMEMRETIRRNERAADVFRRALCDVSARAISLRIARRIARQALDEASSTGLVT